MKLDCMVHAQTKNMSVKYLTKMKSHTEHLITYKLKLEVCMLTPTLY